MPDHATCYAVISRRDARFDGRFYTGVNTTGIFCRPSCPARTPKSANVTFYPHAASALAAGLRPCRRCRPELAPDNPEWNRRADLAAQALAAIESGAVDQFGVAGLARSLGVSERHLRRELNTELGTGPRHLALVRRLRVARILLDETRLSITDITWAAGFGSVRQFNQAFKTAFGAPPSHFRPEKGRARAPKQGDANGAGAVTPIDLTLHAHGDSRWDFTHRYLQARAIPGLEHTEVAAPVPGQPPGAAIRRFARALPGGHIELWAPDTADAGAGSALRARVSTDDLAQLGWLLPTIRRVTDIDTDLDPIIDHLRCDPQLAPWLAGGSLPRLVGTFDGFEVAVRAVVGQQISVSAARTVLGRLVDIVAGHAADTNGTTTGDPNRGTTADATPGPGFRHHGFPNAEAVAAANLTPLGMPSRRKATIIGLAEAVADGTIDLSPSADPRELSQRLVSLPGIGPWTAEYVAMRATSAPDGWPPGDLGLRRALGVAAPDLERRSERWRPWRAYAAMLLWSRSAGAPNRNLPSPDPPSPESFGAIT